MNNTQKSTKKASQKTPAPQLNKMSGNYDGDELRPFNGRNNAMDAFDCPSLVGLQRVKHKPMTGMTSNARTPFYTT